jgi:PAS domain S-box-containing protein
MFTLNPQDNNLHPLMQQVSLFIDEGIIIYDTQGSVVSFNPQALALYPTVTQRQQGNDNGMAASWIVVDREMQPLSREDYPLWTTLRTGQPVSNRVLGVNRPGEPMQWICISTKMIAYLSEQYVLATFHDVSEMMELNQALLEKDRYLQMMVASLDDIIFEVDKHGIFHQVWTNRKEYLLAAPEQFLGRHCNTLLTAELASKLVAEINLAIAGNHSRSFEYSLPGQDGEEWYMARINLMPPCQERITLLVTNITAEKQTALRLQDTEARWKFALEGSGQGLWDWNLVTNSLYMSPIYLSMLGYDEQDFPQQLNSWEKLVHPDDYSRTLADIQAHLDGHSRLYFNEHRLRCKDGTYKWILDRGMVVSRDAEGKPLRMTGTHSDISERIRNLEQTRLNEQKFNNAFQYSGIGMSLVSASGDWLEVNDELCKITGYPREELLRMTFQDITHPEDLEADLKQVQQVLRREIESYSMEKRYLHKRGHYVWVLLTVSMVWNADGTPRYFISQLQEISERKALVDSLASKNRELEMAMSDVEQRMHQLEEFNQIVTHNLRGSAGNVLMLTAELEKETDAANRAEYLQLLKMCGETMGETLNDMMRVLEVRLNHNIPFDSCPLAVVTAKVLQQLQIDIVQSGAEITTVFEVATLSYPLIYLESIVYNLVSNALKYAVPGLPPQIFIRTYLLGSRTCLSVKDNGMGIDLHQYGHQLFKLHKVFHPGHDSKGVGLFITRNHIETLGGSIAVKSEPGHGAEFIVTF